MTDQLSIQYDAPLRKLNSFGIAATAHALIEVTGLPTLKAVVQCSTLSGQPRLVLGGGSNLLLTGDFPGLVLHMRNAGIEVVGEDADYVLVRAAAGENWHRFVLSMLERGFGGLENLSLIPGSVGAAPIQNIGAYGVEIKDRFHSLRYFDFRSGELCTLDRQACGFGYRDSVFKRGLQEHAVIVDVTFAMPRQWQANTQYADVARELEAQGITQPTARDISDAVIAIRTRKLPDPAVIGNAGSFFKNPVVSAAAFESLWVRFPQLISYPQADGSRKLAAGWLIEQCGWKGKSLGDAGVYEKQALVLVNRGRASGAEVAALAAAIQKDVKNRFGVELEPEPVFI